MVETQTAKVRRQNKKSRTGDKLLEELHKAQAHNAEREARLVDLEARLEATINVLTARTGVAKLIQEEIDKEADKIKEMLTGNKS